MVDDNPHLETITVDNKLICYHNIEKKSRGGHKLISQVRVFSLVSYGVYSLSRGCEWGRTIYYIHVLSTSRLILICINAKKID